MRLRLRKGVVLIDSEDLNKIRNYSWVIATWPGRNGSSLPRQTYVQATKKDESGRAKTFLLHRIVMDAPVGTQIDHINRDTLDNRKRNLRFVDAAENQWNRPLCGVRYTKKLGAKNRWEAAIRVRGKRFWLGSYATKEEAIMVYNRASETLRGGV